MRCSLVAGAIQLALSTWAAALAPAADLKLAPANLEQGPAELAKELHAAARVAEAGVESLWRHPGPKSPSAPRMTAELAEELNAAARAAEAGEPVAARSDSNAQVSAQHSHSVLKELIAAGPAKQLADEDQFEAEANPVAQASPAPPSGVPTLPAQPESRQRQSGQEMPTTPPEFLSGWGRAAPGGEFCAGRPIYDGPTLNWEDCRKRCTGHCRFWSYWHDSSQHRCKLTAACGQRERDARHDVTVHWRVQGATDEGGVQAARDAGQASADAGVQADAPVFNHTCSPQGSARKFASSPQGDGWIYLGKARSYIDCANTADSMAYRNLVWNVGSTANGRCYGFNSDVPDVLHHSCEDTYCWLFGPACKSAGQGA